MEERMEMLEVVLEDQLDKYFSTAKTEEELRTKFKQVDTFISGHEEYSILSYYTKQAIVAEALSSHLDRLMGK